MPTRRLNSVKRNFNHDRRLDNPHSPMAKLLKCMTLKPICQFCQLAICLLPLLDVTPPVGVALTGGLLTNDVPLRRSVVTRLREENGLQPIETPVDAVVGALRLAAEARK